MHVVWPKPQGASSTDFADSVGLQKVPPTTVAPTYKLTLPSEFVLTHMPDMMGGDFVMISADATQSFSVSIVPR